MADDVENEETEDDEEYESEFSLGDVVHLKSGGPPMTVDRAPDPSRRGHAHEYHCVWFRGATRQSNFFAEHLLQLYTPPQKK